jgi:hypothetical protein
MTTTTPTFTRYLYDVHQVKYSLNIAILEKQREESLFWAYELYHSGFQDEVWEFVREIYLNYYAVCNPKFKTRLNKFYAEWIETADSCLIGTVVGTLSAWNVDSNEKKFIILYKEDRHKTFSLQNSSLTDEIAHHPRYYLKQVSRYAIRVNESDDSSYSQKLREAYLGVNWLYFCSRTPIWEIRIKENRGYILNDRVEFHNDDDLEAFYEKWGFEPDEQSSEMHNIHGIVI